MAEAIGERRASKADVGGGSGGGGGNSGGNSGGRRRRWVVRAPWVLDALLDLGARLLVSEWVVGLMWWEAARR